MQIRKRTRGPFNRNIKVCILSFLMIFIYLTTCVSSPHHSKAVPINNWCQKMISASAKSIAIGDLQFRIVKVVFDKTAMGFVPSNMGEDQQVLYVELQMLSDLKETFKNLHMKLTDGTGKRSKAIMLISGSIIQMLSNVIWKGTSSEYRPGKESIVWAYVVSKYQNEFYLNFPTGEVIDLSPLIK